MLPSKMALESQISNGIDIIQAIIRLVFQLLKSNYSCCSQLVLIHSLVDSFTLAHKGKSENNLTTYPAIRDLKSLKQAQLNAVVFKLYHWYQSSGDRIVC